jgi:GNAT superfamily N-acetyltransferase
MVTVSEEKAVDYVLTARLATDAFDDANVHFSPARTKWLYEESFGQGATVLSALDDDGQKVGQIALIGQKICIDGEIRAAVQLVDLFVVQAHRSAGLVRRLYLEVEQICKARGIRYILALPNDKSVLLNARFLKLKPLLSLPIRAGLSLRRPSRKLGYSGLLTSLAKPQAIDLLSCFAGAANGLSWDGPTLLSRLSDPTRDYAIHATSDVLLISSCRKRKNFSYVALCAFFVRPQCHLAGGDADELVRAACSFWRIPLFVYAGLHDGLPRLPGLPVPARLRRPIMVQLRDLMHEDDGSARFGCFQLIDSDFA